MGVGGTVVLKKKQKKNCRHQQGASEKRAERKRWGIQPVAVLPITTACLLPGQRCCKLCWEERQAALSLTILNLLLPLAGQYENLGKHQLCKGSVSIMLLHLKVKADFLFPENSRLLLTLIGS